MDQGSRQPLRVLLANERPEHLERIAAVVNSLGHSVVERETDLAAVGALTEAGGFDVAMVGDGEDTEYALDLIGRIVREAYCPVIALLDIDDPVFIRQAAKRGVFAYLTAVDVTNDQLAGAIEIVLHRFAEFHDLEGAFGRRAVTERAKGILMERHAIGEDVAFLMLRDQSRRTNRKLVDIAQAILDARSLLPKRAEPEADG